MEEIVNLLKSNHLDDQLLGCRMALEVLGDDWCQKYLNNNNFDLNYPGNICYWIIKNRSCILVGNGCIYYNNYRQHYPHGLCQFIERGDIIMNLNED